MHNTRSRDIAHDSALQGAHPDTLAARQPAAWLWPLGGTAAVVLVLVLGAWIDQADEARALAEQAAFDAGRRAGQADMMDSAEAAWQMAQAEAARCRAEGAQP